MKIFFLFLLVTLSLLSKQVFAQTKTIDSLKTLLSIEKVDTSKVNLMNNIGIELKNNREYEAANKFSVQAKILAEKAGFKKGIGNSLNNIGNIYSSQGNYPEALKNHMAALKIREEARDKMGIAASLNNIGNIYYRQGNYPETLKNHLASLKIKEEIGDKKGIAASLNNIGNVYQSQGNSPEALKNYLASLKIKKESGDKYGIANSLNNIGNIYKYQGNYPEALKNHLASLKIAEEIGNKSGIGYSLNNIGSVYFEQGNYPEALKNFLASLRISEEIGDQLGIARYLKNIGVIFTATGKPTEAEKWFKRGLQLAKEIGSLEIIEQSYDGLASSDSALGNYKSAYENYKMYILYRDSLINEESSKKMVQQQMQYEFDKKEALTKAEQDKKDAIATEEKEKQSLMLSSVIAGLLLVVSFSGFIYNRFRVTKKQKNIIEKQKEEVDKQRELAESRKFIAEEQKHIIEEKQKEILDSIHYAKRIQHAMLTSESYFDEYLKAEYFIFYQPKDIVSGDFYWAVSHHNKFYIATADCTGHGVPGAFMSLLNISFLNENVIERGIEDPALILNEQRKEIIKALNPKGNASPDEALAGDMVQDGMDCVLTTFDIKNNRLQFAAANNPLWLIRDSELIEFKPDKMPVGKYDEKANDFTSQSVELKKGDIIYTFTDGYADQFGGDKGKKFKYSKLKELLLSIHSEAMMDQKKILAETFETWKGNLEQIDDVLVIGVRV